MASPSAPTPTATATRRSRACPTARSRRRRTSRPSSRSSAPSCCRTRRSRRSSSTSASIPTTSTARPTGSSSRRCSSCTTGASPSTRSRSSSTSSRPASSTRSAAARRSTCWPRASPPSATSASTRGSSARTRCSAGCCGAAYEIQARVHAHDAPPRELVDIAERVDPRGRPRGLAQGLPRDQRRARRRDLQARGALARGQGHHGHAVRLRGPRHVHRRLPARQPDHPRRPPVDGEVGADGELLRERRARRRQGRRAVLARDVASPSSRSASSPRRPRSRATTCARAACPRRAGARSWRRPNRLAKSPLFIDDSSDLSVLDVRAKARRLLQQHPDGLGLIVIDYLQLMRGDGADGQPRRADRADLPRAEDARA